MKEVYEFNTRYPAFDLLCGADWCRSDIICGRPLKEIRKKWIPACKRWEKLRNPYLIYDT